MRAAEALNASLMAENAELRRSSAAMQEAHTAASAAASGDAEDTAAETQRYQLHDPLYVTMFQLIPCNVMLLERCH